MNLNEWRDECWRSPEREGQMFPKHTICHKQDKSSSQTRFTGINTHYTFLLILHTVRQASKLCIFSGFAKGWNGHFITMMLLVKECHYSPCICNANKDLLNVQETIRLLPMVQKRKNTCIMRCPCESQLSGSRAITGTLALCCWSILSMSNWISLTLNFLIQSITLFSKHEESVNCIIHAELTQYWHCTLVTSH